MRVLALIELYSDTEKSILSFLERPIDLEELCLCFEYMYFDCSETITLQTPIQDASIKYEASKLEIKLGTVCRTFQKPLSIFTFLEAIEDFEYAIGKKFDLHFSEYAMHAMFFLFSESEL